MTINAPHAVGSSATGGNGVPLLFLPALPVKAEPLQAQSKSAPTGGTKKRRGRRHLKRMDSAGSQRASAASSAGGSSVKAQAKVQHYWARP